MSYFDPTTNCIPFGLLSKDEQSALLDWTHGWEFYHWEGKWDTIGDPSWSATAVYRGKPAPVVVTTWSPIYGNGRVGFSYKSHDEAINAANQKVLIAILRLDITNGVATAHLEEI